MASSASVTLDVVHASLPLFKGEGYDRWSVRMKTLFRSQNLWKVVEEGVLKEGTEDQIMESHKDDAKALYLIQ